jgi:Tfp pilus assembly protein PilX
MIMKNKQSGAVLVISLILLTVITMLSLSGMRMANMEIMMAKNYQEGVTALSEAENGLSDFRHRLTDDPVVAAAIVDELVANDEFTFCLGGGPGGTGADCPTAGGMSNRRYDVTVNNYGLYVPAGQTVGVARTMDIKSLGTTITKARRVVYSHAIALNMALEASAALSLYDTGDMVLNGNPEISGFDHHVPNNFNCNGGGCSGSDNADGTEVIGIYSEGGADIIQNGVPTIEGAPSEQTGGGELDGDFWTEYATAADMMADARNGEAWGTRDNPIVHIVDGDLSVMGNLDGAGILVVKGAELSIGGNFHFEGIILVMSETGASITMSGTTRIFGSLVVVGPAAAINFTGGGTPEILHSSEAITQMSVSQSWKMATWSQSY